MKTETAQRLVRHALRYRRERDEAEKRARSRLREIADQQLDIVRLEDKLRLMEWFGTGAPANGGRIRSLLTAVRQMLADYRPCGCRMTQTQDHDHGCPVAEMLTQIDRVTDAMGGS